MIASAENARHGQAASTKKKKKRTFAQKQFLVVDAFIWKLAPKPRNQIKPFGASVMQPLTVPSPYINAEDRIKESEVFCYV